MSKKFDLNDDTVAVVIGSGAGGGTLSNAVSYTHLTLPTTGVV